MDQFWSGYLNLFEKVNGYDDGLWKRIDTSFYKKVLPLNPEIVDISKTDPIVITSSIALQHLDNIWGRSAKGLLSNKPQQLSNFYSEPININIADIFPELFNDYKKMKKHIINIYKKKHPIKYLLRKIY